MSIDVTPQYLPRPGHINFSPLATAKACTIATVAACNASAAVIETLLPQLGRAAASPRMRQTMVGAIRATVEGTADVIAADFIECAGDRLDLANLRETIVAGPYIELDEWNISRDMVAIMAHHPQNVALAIGITAEMLAPHRGPAHALPKIMHTQATMKVIDNFIAMPEDIEHADHEGIIIDISKLYDRQSGNPLPIMSTTLPLLTGAICWVSDRMDPAQVFAAIRTVLIDAANHDPSGTVEYNPVYGEVQYVTTSRKRPGIGLSADAFRALKRLAGG